MADKKISQLNTATTIFDADVFTIVQDGETKRANASTAKAYAKDGLSKSDVGLGNVDNTSDANKPVSTATQTALDSKQATTAKNAANGYAGLDANAKLPTSLLPALAISEYLGSVANQAARLALTGQKGDWCSQTNDGKVYVITGDDPTDNANWTALTYPVTPGITLNGTSIAPGDTATISAATTNTLTIGTGLSGTSFNGSSAVTVAIDSTVATLTGAQTLTGKTISGADNTLSNIGNSSLTNSSITINGNAVSLGGSTTVSAATTNTLTIGTGLSGTSFNGSSAVTIAIDSSVVTLTGTQTLTNKTLTSPAISGGTVNNVAIGGTTPAAGNFTTLGATGNVTLGDAAGDTLTINGTAVSIPNNLNFDSNTLFIDAANNNVGIGTALPVTKLSLVNGVLSVAGATAGSGVVKLGDPTDPIPYVGMYRSAAAAMGTAGNFLNLGGYDGIAFTAGPVSLSSQNEQARITAKGLLVGYTSDASLSGTGNAIFSGNVGIGTSSPAYKLDVRGLATTGVAAPVSTVSIPDTNGNRGGFAVLNASGGTLAGIAAQQIAGGNYPNAIGRLDVWVQNGAATTTAATFDSSGNVGIGTSSPGAKLHVSGGRVKIFGDNDPYQLNLFYAPGVSGFWLGCPGANALAFYTDAGTERMRIDSSGNVGIGTSSPIGKLQVKAANPQIYMEDSAAGANGKFTAIGTSNGTMTFSRYLDSGALVGQFMTLDSGGNLLVGCTSVNYKNSGFTLSSDGATKWLCGPYASNQNTFYVSAASSYGVYLSSTTVTSWASASDERLKTDLKPIENAAQKVSTLRAVTGRFKTDEENISRAFLIAQDIQKVLPEAVDDADSNKLGVRYTETIPLLVAAIQELHAEIELLKQRIH